MTRKACIRAVVLGFLGACAPAAMAQGIIELRASARVAAGAPVCLEQVATLEGPDAEALAKAVVLPASERGPAEAVVTLEQVRAAVRNTGRPNWARLAVRGGACRVIAEGPAPVAPRPGTPVKLGVPTDPAGTIRAAVISRIGQVARVAAADLRLAFAAEDDEFLNQAVGGRTLEIRPTAASDRLPLAITIYDGDRIVASRTVRVGVELRRSVAVASVPKRRGEDLGRDDFALEQRWVGLSASPAPADQLAGASVCSRLGPGQMICATDISPPVVVSKGDQVTVHCVSGGVLVTARARAMAQARDGEMIEFQSLDGKRRFPARVNGRGRAVMSADGGGEKPR